MSKSHKDYKEPFNKEYGHKEYFTKVLKENISCGDKFQELLLTITPPPPPSTATTTTTTKASLPEKKETETDCETD